ncbi:helix-turn-helix domain-containing protein [bacterium]|nr:helix-turn-helix domain-containing protein [bacterium]
MDTAKLKGLFGRRVRSLRKLRDLTQEELAEATSLSAEYVSKVERGLASPSFDVIAKLASALQVDPSALFDFTELHGNWHDDK